jgi:carbamate kinase
VGTMTVKDHASEKLAENLNAIAPVTLMAVEKASANYNKAAIKFVESKAGRRAIMTNRK